MASLFHFLVNYVPGQKSFWKESIHKLSFRSLNFLNTQSEAETWRAAIGCIRFYCCVIIWPVTSAVSDQAKLSGAVRDSCPIRRRDAARQSSWGQCSTVTDTYLFGFVGVFRSGLRLIAPEMINWMKVITAQRKKLKKNKTKVEFTKIKETKILCLTSAVHENQLSPT